jgi:ABC-2 type transport system ATP-binding protein
MILSVKNIKKTYNKQIVLNNISFDIPKNSVTGIIGPNGAGKSTLLKIITGFENPDNGEIWFENRKLRSFNEKISIFSYMPEHINIYPEYYVEEFLIFLKNTTNYENTDLIHSLGLNFVKSKKVKNLSKGFKQRLKLYFALASRKKIVVLDEPFDGFDPLQVIEILKIIKYENEKERTFLISIHQLNDAEKICNFFVLLNQGNTVIYGDKEFLSKKCNVKNATLEEIFIKLLKKE